MKIELADGKYTLLQNNDGTGLKALRHGEEWRDCCGDNLIAELGRRIEDLEIYEHLVDTTASLNVELMQKIEILKAQVADLKAQIQLNAKA